MNPRLALEADKAASQAMIDQKRNVNVSSLISESKNYNLNLKDFGD